MAEPPKLEVRTIQFNFSYTSSHNTDDIMAHDTCMYPVNGSVQSASHIMDGNSRCCGLCFEIRMMWQLSDKLICNSNVICACACILCMRVYWKGNRIRYHQEMHCIHCELGVCLERAVCLVCAWCVLACLVVRRATQECNNVSDPPKNRLLPRALARPTGKRDEN